MNCPNCNSNHLIVADSRNKEFGIQRRRECLDCGVRFNTVEINMDEYKELKEMKLLLLATKKPQSEA